MSCADFTLCDLKLRPAKDSAAARVPVEDWLTALEPVGVGGFDAIGTVFRRWTDSCKLFARAFSCCRMYCATAYYPESELVFSDACHLNAFASLTRMNGFPSWDCWYSISLLGLVLKTRVCLGSGRTAYTKSARDLQM